VGTRKTAKTAMVRIATLVRMTIRFDLGCISDFLSSIVGGIIGSIHVFAMKLASLLSDVDPLRVR
jgi:hypothetical protein